MSGLRVLVAIVSSSLIALAVLVVVAAFTGLPEVGDLTHHTPRRTALMRARAQEAIRDGRRFVIDERWVPYERISPTLRRAVLIAEDDAFFSHDGLDWNEIRASAQVNLRRGRDRARRQHHHAAAREEPLPRRGAHHCCASCARSCSRAASSARSRSGGSSSCTST